MKTQLLRNCASSLCLAGALFGYNYSAKGSAAALAAYNFYGDALTATSVGTHNTASSITIGPGAHQMTSVANTLDLSTYPNSTQASAIANGSYFEFTVTPNAGYLLDLTTLSFTATLDGGSGGFDLRSSLDNYTSDITSTGTPGTGTTFNTISASLSASQYQNLSSSITFIEYTWGGTGTTNYVQNLALGGSAVLAPVPEPSTLAFFGLGAGAMILFMIRSYRVAGDKKA